MRLSRLTVLFAHVCAIAGCDASGADHGPASEDALDAHEARGGVDAGGGGAGVTLLGTCLRPEAAATVGRVVFAGPYSCGPPSVPRAVTVSDVAAWAPVRTDLEACTAVGTAALAGIDLASEYVVVLGYPSFSSCGLDLEEVITRMGGAGPYVELELTDRSAGCRVRCAMGAALVAVVAVPRGAGEAPTVCRRVHHGCD